MPFKWFITWFRSFFFKQCLKTLWFSSSFVCLDNSRRSDKNVWNLTFKKIEISSKSGLFEKLSSGKMFNDFLSKNRIPLLCLRFWMGTIKSNEGDIFPSRKCSYLVSVKWNVKKNFVCQKTFFALFQICATDSRFK